MVHESFLILEAIHEALEEKFLLHQEALLDFDWPAATGLLARYRQGLMLHMDHEEQHLMALFERNGEMKRWPAKLYYGEHEKMRHLLDRIENRLLLLSRMPPPAKRMVLQLLELETTYKHLCEHHHVREHQNFFPILDQVTSPEEKQRTIGLCLSEWEAFRSQLSPQPEPLARPETW